MWYGKYEGSTTRSLGARRCGSFDSRQTTPQNSDNPPARLWTKTAATLAILHKIMLVFLSDQGTLPTAGWESLEFADVDVLSSVTQISDFFYTYFSIRIIMIYASFLCHGYRTCLQLCHVLYSKVYWLWP